VAHPIELLPDEVTLLTEVIVDQDVAREDGRHDRLLKSLARIDLLILDDWGLQVLAQLSSDHLEILEDRNARRSTLITSQVPIDQWRDVIGDPTLADAILDRFVHNAHRLKLNGDSMREPKPAEAVTLTITPDPNNQSVSLPTAHLRVEFAPTLALNQRRRSVECAIWAPPDIRATICTP
jgi:hypothetical protein